MLPSTTLLPRGETLFHLPPINNLEIFKDFPSTTRKYSKTFSPAELSFRRKSPISRKYSQTFRPAAATSSSDQLQQSAAASSSGDQQQQSTVATGISNQHSSYQQHLHNQRRPPLVIRTVPSRGYFLAVDLGLAAR